MKKAIQQKSCPMSSLGRDSRQNKIIVIVGTTSSGKSDLAVQIAKQFNGEIISADSRQVYRELDIGTGKITKKEMRGVAHHMLDIASPRRAFSVAQFKKKGEQALKDIIKRGKIPIIAGGTGFYIDALLGSNTLPEVPPNPKLRTQLEKKSASELFAKLKKLDPRRARGIDRHNPRRLIRAIEIATAIGSVPHLDAQRPNEYEILWIGLRLEKETLTKKIAKRHQKMLRSGLLAEIKKLRAQKISWKRIYELGFEYKFLAQVLRGEISKEEALQKMNTDCWHYAKRQTSWFKHNKKINWFTPADTKAIQKLVAKFLKK